jgi:hypothetical protein
LASFDGALLERIERLDVNLLIPTEAAYIAGLVDGEGSIGLVCHVSKNGFNFGYPTMCRIANTNTNLLYWVQETTGIGSVLKGSARANKSKHKPGWIWNCETVNTVEFLEAILVYLVIKDEQARLLIRYIKETRSDARGMHHSLSVDEVDSKRYIYNRLRELNKQGI